MDDAQPGPVFVQVVPVDSGREIGWTEGLAERLRDRVDDIHQAIVDGAATVAGGLRRLSAPEGWQIDEVSASFGVTLAAEAGVVLSKTSGEATFEVSVTYRRATG